MLGNRHFGTILNGLKSLQNGEVEFIIFEVDDDLQGYVQFIIEGKTSLKGEARNVEITEQQSEHLKQIGWESGGVNLEKTWELLLGTKLDTVAEFSVRTLEEVFGLTAQKDLTVMSDLG